MSRKKRFISILSIVGVIALGAGAMLLLTSQKAQTAKQEAPAPVREVRTLTLEAEEVQLWIEGSGFLTPARTLELKTSLGGQVAFAEGNLKGGTEVTQGERLLLLDNRSAENGYHTARLELLKLCSAFLPQVQDRTEDYQSWREYITLIEKARGGFIPAPPAREGRQSLLAATQGVSAAWYRLKEAALTLEQHELTAPFSGILTGSGVSVGSWITPGVPLATLVDRSRLELPLPLSRVRLKEITVGSEVLLKTTGEDEEIPGRVERIEPILTPGAQTALVHVVIDNPPDSPAWLPGGWVSARIRGRRLDGAYRVSRRHMVGDRLPIFEEGKLRLLNVTKLAEQGEEIFLAPILPEGTEMIITTLQIPLEGMALVKEGSHAPDA